MAPPERPSSDVQDQAAEISALIGDTTAAYTDGLPADVQTHVSHDTVLVVLRGALSSGERSLADAGGGDQVLSMRRAFQHVMRADFINGIQSITGRHVCGFFSDHQLEPDVSVEVFVLDDT